MEHIHTHILGQVFSWHLETLQGHPAFSLAQGEGMPRGSFGLRKPLAFCEEELAAGRLTNQQRLRDCTEEGGLHTGWNTSTPTY